MSSILSRCRLLISKRGYQSRAPTAIKRVMFYSSLQAAVSNSIYSNINFKVKQVVCLEAIYRGRDVVAVLPTRYGKSMIFHLLPSLFLDKIKCESRVAPSPVIIVVSPLNALIKDQLRRLKEGNVKATVLSVKGENEDLELDSRGTSRCEIDPNLCCQVQIQMFCLLAQALRHGQGNDSQFYLESCTSWIFPGRIPYL